MTCKELSQQYLGNELYSSLQKKKKKKTKFLILNRPYDSYLKNI